MPKVYRTRIAFSMNKVAQFMQALTDEHWSIDPPLPQIYHSIWPFLSRHSSVQLTTYTDADWAGRSMIENPPVAIMSFLVQISFLEAWRSSALWHDLALRQSIGAWQYCNRGRLVAVITSWSWSPAIYPNSSLWQPWCNIYLSQSYSSLTLWDRHSFCAGLCHQWSPGCSICQH